MENSLMINQTVHAKSPPDPEFYQRTKPKKARLVYVMNPQDESTNRKKITIFHLRMTIPSSPLNPRDIIIIFLSHPRCTYLAL